MCSTWPKKKLRPAAPRLDRVSMVHLDNSRSGFTCSMRNFLELSPNDWETKRTICEMDLNRWFPREKDPMIFIVAKSLHIWIIYLYMFCCIKKIYYLFTTRVTTTNLYCGFFPKLIGGKCSTPPLWNHCSCPHSLLSRFLFLRIIPTTSNNRWKHMKKHRTLIFPYDSLWLFPMIRYRHLGPFAGPFLQPVVDLGVIELPQPWIMEFIRSLLKLKLMVPNNWRCGQNRKP